MTVFFLLRSFCMYGVEAVVMKKLFFFPCIWKCIIWTILNRTMFLSRRSSLIRRFLEETDDSSFNLGAMGEQAGPASPNVDTWFDSPRL